MQISVRFFTCLFHEDSLYISQLGTLQLPGGLTDKNNRGTNEYQSIYNVVENFSDFCINVRVHAIEVKIGCC